MKTCKELIVHFNDFVVGRFTEESIKKITRGEPVEGDRMEILFAVALWEEVLSHANELLAVQPEKQLILWRKP